MEAPTTEEAQREDVHVNPTQEEIEADLARDSDNENEERLAVDTQQLIAEKETTLATSST